MPRRTHSEIEETPEQFDRAEDVEAIAEDLIGRFHSHLADCRIAYLFKNKKITKGGKEVLATAEKCSAKTKALVAYEQTPGVDAGNPFDFCIVVSYAAWTLLSEKQKSALIDHELSHCQVDETDEGEITYSIVRHDVEEFTNVARRWGAYSHDLTLFKSAINGEPEKKLAEHEEIVSAPKPAAIEDARAKWHVGKDADKKVKPKEKQIVVREAV
jgi:hypothetical protein